MLKLFCRTLGPLEMTLDGQPAPAKLLWKKQAALLIYLARSSGGRRSREHLVGLLWPEKEEAKARHSLRQTISIIKTHCGSDSVEANASQVALNADLVSLDLDTVSDFEQAEDWSALSSMWGGEFLEGFSVPHASEFDLWLEAERREHRLKFLELFVRAADGLLSDGDLGPAIEIANLALTIDSASDAAVQIAIRATALAGRRGTAIALFEEFQRGLDDLGIQTSEATVELVERVRKQTRWGRAIAEKSDEEIVAERPPLVGRKKELAGVLKTWKTTIRKKKCSVVIVEGDPGTGKTRLIEELSMRAGFDGALTANMRVVSSDQNHDWSGIVAVSRHELLAGRGVAGTNPDSIASFVAVSEEWADEFVGIKPAAGELDLQMPFRDLLDALSEEQPVVLCFDGAHQLDGSSLQTIQFVLRELSNRPIMVVLIVASGHQRDEVNEIQSEVGRGVAGAVIKMNTLDTEALTELASWSLPDFDEEQVARLVRRVQADSAGLPLLAVEMLQAVAAGLELVSGGDVVWPIPFRTLDQTMPADLPGNVVGAIRVRFGCLSPVAKKVLEVASVLEEPVSEKQLGSGSGFSGEGLSDALDELEWTRWLAADARGYSFTARIVREVVLRDMVSGGKKRRILDAVNAGN